MNREPEFVFAPVHATVVHEDGNDLVEEALTLACDFCLDTRVVWDYPCEDFTIDEIGFGSQGEWCACQRCSEYIEGRFLPLLTLRTVRSTIKRGQTLSPSNLDAYGRIQQGFFDHRAGERKPHVP